MKTAKEFVDSLVKITYQESLDAFGHYPFQMVSLSNDDQLTLTALAQGGQVQRCYDIAREEIEKPSTFFFMSLDFPANENIENDFVAILSLIGGKADIFAIPYDTKNGDMKPIIDSKNPTLVRILSEFKESAL